jgi:putative restriction endonuclease
VANAVFIAKINSDYDDAVEVRYHFPKMYLSRIQRTVGDWIIYYEPRGNGGRMAYFAIARVLAVEPDQSLPGHYYARIGNYLEFPSPVPLNGDGTYLESSLRHTEQTINTAASRTAVRILPVDEFEHIRRLGMAPALNDIEATAEEAVAETQSAYAGPRPEILTARPLRDAAFARIVRKAYDRTCAMTGLQLVNGGGRCEIEAAHIRPVENDGPDSPRNGLALSRTVHWLFDRGFLSLEDNGTILQAPRLVPEPVKRLLNPEGVIRLPHDRNSAPHGFFLRWHRENKFKG